MSRGYKIDVGDEQRGRVVQNKSDIKEGVKRGDLSRTSVYVGKKHIHFGANSKTKITNKS